MSFSSIFRAGVALAFMVASQFEMSTITDWQTVEYFGSPEAAREYIDSVVASAARTYATANGYARRRPPPS